jgi:hypothetical protein
VVPDVSRRRKTIVAKRDGSLEVFSLSKLSRSVQRALRDAELDPHLAIPLSKAIKAHVSAWEEAEPPTTEHIFECARAVLAETGCEAAAVCFDRHRRQRSARRERISVIDQGASVTAPEPWSKTRLVTSLQRKYGLRYAVARSLAGEVESKIVVMEYRVVSSGLIWEIVRHELAAWGLLSVPVAVAAGMDLRDTA